MNYVLGQDLSIQSYPEPGFTVAESDMTYVVPGGVIAPGQGGEKKEVIVITDTGVQVVKDVEINKPPSMLRPILWIVGGLLAWEFLT